MIDFPLSTSPPQPPSLPLVNPVVWDTSHTVITTRCTPICISLKDPSKTIAVPNIF